MAERFVVGFAVDMDELGALVGGGRAASELIEAAGGADEVDELLSERGDPITSEQAIAAITSGQLDDERAYEYRRVTELIATATGERFEDEIDVICTYYLPNESHGRWNPVLKALSLVELAGLWGTSNSPFPWSDGVSRSSPRMSDWPIATFLSPEQVKALTEELAAFDAKTLAELPGDQLAEDASDPDEVNDAREELAAGLGTLAEWLKRAAAQKRGLLMMMDGSQ